jgi:GDP-L-fucose synthase
MRVYVAGHNGMVGSALIRNRRSEDDIILMERTDLDLEDRSAVRRFLQVAKPDVILLAAAKVGGILSNSKNQTKYLLQNLRIQDAVISSAAEVGVRKLLFLGSSCIYPRLAAQPISESQLLTGALEPTNEAYALAKITGIKLCRSVYEESGYDYFSVMPTNLYGPNDNYDLESGHVPAALIRKFHEAKTQGLPNVTVWGTGTPKREFMHVDDLARACWFFAINDTKGQLINVGTGMDLSIRDFALLVAKTVGYNGEIVFDKSKPDGTPRKLLDVSLANSLGWKYEIDLELGLKETYTWFIEAVKKGEVRGY